MLPFLPLFLRSVIILTITGAATIVTTVATIATTTIIIVTSLRVTCYHDSGFRWLKCPVFFHYFHCFSHSLSLFGDWAVEVHIVFRVHAKPRWNVWVLDVINQLCNYICLDQCTDEGTPNICPTDTIKSTTPI
jgi:hypothetical protein